MLRDITWAIVSSIGSICVQIYKSNGNAELKLDGSWTAFMKDTSRNMAIKCKLEYLPVVPLGDNITKYYLDMNANLAYEIKLAHIFLHAKETLDN